MHTLFKPNVDPAVFQSYKIDCENCCGLCCVAFYFSKMEGFPADKDAGIACKNLEQGFTCSIHGKLSERRLKGCMAYDCFGAGQQVTRLFARKPDWNKLAADDANRIFEVYLKILQIQQILWYLTEASMLCLPVSTEAQITLLLEEGRKITTYPLEMLQNLDINAFREKSNQLLKHISAMIFAEFYPNASMQHHKDYMGKNMKGKNLRGKDFSMSFLIAANLEQADLYGANFLGADLRDTNICDTDLRQCLFLTQMQINTAKGNQYTIIPSYLNKPVSWQQR